MEFLNKKLNQWERSKTFKCDKIDPCKSDECKNTRSTVSALHSSSLSVKNTKKCDQKGHSTASCWVLKKMSFDERKVKITKFYLYFRCPGMGHVAKGCLARCEKCKGPHYHLLCKSRAPSPQTEIVCETVEVMQSNNDNKLSEIKNPMVSHTTLSNVSMNRARKSRTTLQNKVRLKVLPEQLTLFANTSVTFKKCIIQYFSIIPS